MTLLFSISIMELAFDALTRLLLFLNLSIGKFAKSFSPAPFLFSFIVSYYHFWTWTSIPCSVSLHTLHIRNIYVFKKNVSRTHHCDAIQKEYELHQSCVTPWLAEQATSQTSGGESHTDNISHTSHRLDPDPVLASTLQHKSLATNTKTGQFRCTFLRSYNQHHCK